MVTYNDVNKTRYDKEKRIWKGPKGVNFYSKSQSLGQIAFEEMRRAPRKICQISDSENTTLTNDEARFEAIRIARHFEYLDIKQSDIIGIAGRNTTHLFPVALACFFHGSAYHAINPNYDKITSKHLFEITKPKIIFCDGQDLEKIRFAASGFESKIYTLKDHIKGENSVLDLLKSTGDEAEYEPAELESGPDQTLAILCSSGSTGVPKAVTIPNCSRVEHMFDIYTSEDTQLVLSTMDWLSALFSLQASIKFSTSRVITDKPVTPEYFLELVQKYKVTGTLTSPPMMAAIAKCPQATPEKLDSLRSYFFGGSSSSPSVLQKMQSLLRNGTIICGYGFTEYNIGISRNLHYGKKPNSVGVLLSGVKVRVVNGEGKNLGPNEIGEIWARHDEYWGGYYNNEEATRTIYDNEGWFHSGDLGYFDDDNFLYIVERIKDLLKYKAIQYYPSEIEQVIAEMPNVKEVCVFGVQTDLEGDIAGAAVVKVKEAPLSSEDVVKYVRKNIEADYKQLWAGCVLLDELPKTANNKIDRKAAKAIFLKGRG